MKRTRTPEATEKIFGYVIIGFRDLNYVADDNMPMLLQAMRKRGANIKQLMGLCDRECPCTCPKCQRDWLHAVCKDHRNAAGKRDILCTGLGKSRQWFYLDGMCYEASLANGRMNRDQVIEFLVKVETSMVKMRRRQTAAIQSIRETIKQLQTGTAFEPPPWPTQDTMWGDIS